MSDTYSSSVISDEIKKHTTLRPFAEDFSEAERLAFAVYKSIIERLRKKNASLTYDQFMSDLDMVLTELYGTGSTKLFWSAWATFVWKYMNNP